MKKDLSIKKKTNTTRHCHIEKWATYHVVWSTAKTNQIKFLLLFPSHSSTSGKPLEGVILLSKLTKRTLLTRFMGVGQSDVPPICQLSQEFLLQCNNFQFLFTWNHFETANLLWESLKSCFSFPNQSFIWDTFLTHCSEESQYGEGPKGNTGILGPYAVGKALSCVIPTRYREKGNTFSAINIRHFIYHQIKITHK